MQTFKETTGLCPDASAKGRGWRPAGLRCVQGDRGAPGPGTALGSQMRPEDPVGTTGKWTGPSVRWGHRHTGDTTLPLGFVAECPS